MALNDANPSSLTDPLCCGLSRLYQTRVSWRITLYAQTLGTSRGQRQPKALTADYFITTTSVVFFWSPRMSFRRLVQGRKWKTVCTRNSIQHL